MCATSELRTWPCTDPELDGSSVVELVESYKALTDEERKLDPTTNAMEGVSTMIGGGVNKKYREASEIVEGEDNRFRAPAPNSSGGDAEFSGSSVVAGAAPLVALAVATAAFFAFSGGACDNPTPGSATARACEEQAEYKRTGVRPENDFQRWQREVRESSASKLESFGI